ncbi:MAG: helix-turn-helix domain-containing protein [Gemmatimonadetes bacterium]|nr:helix-turn-helix domain-containing protein [Gemmatimonadota bacterium]
MSSQADAALLALARFAPPYEHLVPQVLGSLGALTDWRGSALVWRLVDAAAQWPEYAWLASRPAGLPLIVLLPHPDDIDRTVPLLRRVRELRPRAVVPGAVLGTPEHLRALLAAPPRSVAGAVTEFLRHRGVLRSDAARREVHRVMELAPEVVSISQLARRLYTSRRTLGRHFSEWGLPVPSHWLQFGRLLHVCMHLHAESTAVFRLAARARYPDGFTLSNQMKRLIGYRPSEVRRLLGWEWIVEAWLEKEGLA